MTGIVVDTNIFVAAGFNPRSASARLISDLREGRFLLVWNEPTRRETEMILRRIPRLSWDGVSVLFRGEGYFDGPVDPAAFTAVVDPDDRKFAALSAAARCLLISNDAHLLDHRDALALDVLTPSAFMERDS
ncbi:PIN domain-containing protein [Microvirga roseola]|uniref:PIN domain-containing protein n=1 Tax=Microvirga roseola TaxID=2883126 RepID=UPI001E39A2A8|nr:PIN domain-containing protein [Microvirga roseola]